MRCFVIMPFGNPKADPQNARKSELIYSQWIKPTVEGIPLPSTVERISCHRADKEAGPGEIISHVIEQLITSDIVIADLSGRNPNVFYELGVRHTVSGNTILITENIDDIPFDLRGLRTIVYQYEPEQMLALKTSLEESILQILREPNKVDNPVSRFLGGVRMETFAGRQLATGQDAVKKFSSELSLLRKELEENRDQMREILKSVTTLQQVHVAGHPASGRGTYDISDFQGIWYGSPIHGVYCARVIDGELLVPYALGLLTEVTGHLYNCRVLGDRLFCRFAWFDSDVAGLVALKIGPTRTLIGGWWYAQDLPRRVLRDIDQLHESNPGMNAIVLEKADSQAKFPYWAEEYFANPEFFARSAKGAKLLRDRL
jgi:hypothetical protein